MRALARIVAFELAERDGFPDICQHASAADLMVLSEAARFAKKSGKARQALLALRGRYPGEALSALAAFSFGGWRAANGRRRRGFERTSTRRPTAPFVARPWAGWLTPSREVVTPARRRTTRGPTFRQYTDEPMLRFAAGVAIAALHRDAIVAGHAHERGKGCGHEPSSFRCSECAARNGS